MKKSIILSLVCVMMLGLFSCKTKKEGTTTDTTSGKRVLVKFQKSDKLQPLLAKAKAEGKLVFVDFYADWCFPCKMMDKDVFTDKEIAKFMNDNFISYKVDVETDNGSLLAGIYSVSALPTVAFLDGNGKVLEKNEGAVYHTQLRQMGESALAKADS